MDKVKKRERNVNFSSKETEKLISLVETYKNVIENKKSGAVTWQEKEKAWKTIETQFNSSGAEAFRNAKHLKLKYEALKRDIRKKFRVIHAKRYKTGDVMHEVLLTPVEQKVKEMILLSVEGSENIYDSDHLDVARNESGEFDIAEATVEGLITDSDTESNNLSFEIPEKPPKKRHQTEANEPVRSTSEQDQDILEIPQKKWAVWEPASVVSKQHMYKPTQKKFFDKLVERKLEIVELQKKLIEEELEEKMLKKQMLKDEMQHKNELHNLEKEQLLLKIKILKTELDNKMNLQY